MALSHIYCNKFSFETFDVISVWLLLCYKSFKYCVVSALLIQGWHRSTEIGPFEVWSLHASIGIFWLLDCLFLSLLCLCGISSFAIFRPQYSLSSSKYLPLDMCIAFHSLVERYTIYGRTLFILAFSAFHPFWQSMPMEEKFQRVLWRSLESCLFWLWFVPKHTHLLRMHYWLFHCMVMHNSLYKLSWKWLSSITKMGEIERTCGAPMCGFGNWWQSLWTNGCLELYLKVLSIGFSWSTCVGFKESLCRPRCY